MINSQDIKNGVCIRMDGRLYFVIEFLHVKPGKGNTIMRVKFKDVVDGRVLERRFNIGEKLEDVRVERRPYQFLYKEGEDFIFMNNETFEQVPIAHDLITGVDFLKEGMTSNRQRLRPALRYVFRSSSTKARSSVSTPVTVPTASAFVNRASISRKRKAQSERVVLLFCRSSYFFLLRIR